MIYLGKVSDLDEELLREAVCPERAEYAAKYKNKIDRLRSLGAAVLLQKGLMREYGIDDTPVRITHLPTKQPMIADCVQLLGKQVYISMTHSGDYAGVAIAECPIGLDLEKFDGRPGRGVSVAKHYFTEGENLRIKQADDPEEAFYRCWTLRESFLKCVGLGLALPFDAFHTECVQDGVTVFTHQVNEHSYYGMSIPTISGYALSIAGTDRALLQNLVSNGTICLSL